MLPLKISLKNSLSTKLVLFFSFLLFPYCCQSNGLRGDDSEASERLIQTFSGHTDKVTSVAFGSDGKTFASSSFDNKVIL